MKNFKENGDKTGKKMQKVVSLCSHKGQDLKRFLKRKTRNMTTSKGNRVKRHKCWLGMGGK